MGVAHVSCLAEQAKILWEEAEENNLDWEVKYARMDRWNTCELCEQRYHGVVKCALGWACWKTYVGLPEASVARMNAMTELANGLHDARNDEDALPVREAELATRRRHGDAEGNLLTVQSNLAITYGQLGQREKALSMERDAYAGYLKLDGEEHSSTLRAANNYASSLAALQRFEEAKSVLRKTIPVTRRVIGEGHELTLKARLVYGQALYEDSAATLDDLREAVTTLEEIEPTAQQVFGGAHPITSSIRQSLHLARVARCARETPLRFKVGSRVECCVGTNRGEAQWAPGTVIKLWYTEDSFAQGFYAPYQVELDEGRLIFAPEDSDKCIRGKR